MSKNVTLPRRSFLKCVAAGSWVLSLPVRTPAQSPSPEKRAPLRFGLIADVHKDVMHDADERLQVFIEHMVTEKVDFILQLGDFCVPKEQNRGFLAIWNQFAGPRYHVLGNHDTDGGFTREQTVQYWGMKSRFYSFDRGGVHFVVLDGNDKPVDHKSGYPRFIAADQLDWLAGDLAATQFPTLIFVHQSLERPDQGGVMNGAAVREVLERTNQESGFRKVLACFSGHHHRDYVRQIRDIVYPQINSASYHWVGGNYLKVRYSEAIDAEFPYIKYTVPYKDPIYALVTLDKGGGFMKIDGEQSQFVGPAPWDLGETREHWDAATLTAGVSNWKLPI